MNSNVVKKGRNDEDRTRDDCISRQAAIDKITKRLFETAFNNVGIKQNIDETLVDVAENRLENWFNELPSIQPTPCEDAVSRKAVLSMIDTYMNKSVELHYLPTSDGIKKLISILPSVQSERKMGHWICESQWSDTMGTYWNTWKCDQCNCVATKGWEHTESGMKPKGKFCSECGSIVSEKVIYVNITEKE